MSNIEPGTAASNSSFSVSFRIDGDVSNATQNVVKTKVFTGHEPSSSSQPSTSTNFGPVDPPPLNTGQVKRLLQGLPLKPKQRAKGVCRVCSASKCGVHYGALLCQTCSRFFSKCLDNPLAFILRPCITGKQKCPVTEKVHPCQFCRAKKCLSVGLSRNKLTEGERSKLDRSIQNQDIGAIIDSDRMVLLLRKAAVWGKISAEKQKRIDKNVKKALYRKISKKWYSKYVEVPATGAVEPLPLLPRPDPQPPQQVIIIPIQTTSTGECRTLDETGLNAVVSGLGSDVFTAPIVFDALSVNPKQMLTAQEVGALLKEATSGVLQKMGRVRFENEAPPVEFVQRPTGRFLYNSSERPVVDHWRRLESHFNDLLCALVKFAKSLPQFDGLTGDEQHSLLSGTLLDMLFISQLLFVDELSSRYFLNSGCVYSLQYLCYVFSGCSGAGDFFRSMFEFCRRLSSLVSTSEEPNRLPNDRLGIILALTLFSPPPSFALNVDDTQKHFLAMLKSDLGVGEEASSSTSASSSSEGKLSSLLACLSSLGLLAAKHRRMVLSVRDNADITLAVDLHAELLDLNNN